jgi:hypothetical protein
MAASSRPREASSISAENFNQARLSELLHSRGRSRCIAGSSSLGSVRSTPRVSNSGWGAKRSGLAAGDRVLANAEADLLERSVAGGGLGAATRALLRRVRALA